MDISVQLLLDLWEKKVIELTRENILLKAQLETALSQPVEKEVEQNGKTD